MAEDLQSLRQSLIGEKPRPIREGVKQLGESFAEGIGDLRNELLQKDVDFDPSGVPDFGLRSGLSRMDTPAERKKFLDDWAGPKGWTQDRYGAYALTPAGMTRLGYPHKGKPVLIDEPWSLTRYDVADLAGEAPAIAGATAGALATGGAGFIPGVLATAGGAALGKAGGEAVEALRGENLQTFPQVMGDVGEEALLGAVGEGVFRSALAPLGRKMLRPRANKMTSERAELAQTAREMGGQPTVTQIAPSGLLGRYQGMADTIFGNPLARKNAHALEREMRRLRSATKGRGPAGRLSVGDRIAGDIGRARGALARWSKLTTNKIDEVVQGEPIVPLNRLKEQAQETLAKLPRDAEGNITMASGELVKSLEDIAKLPDFYTTGEMQQVTSRLFDAIGNETIVPGITGRNARLLWRASTDTYEDIVDPSIRDALLKFRARYHQEITRFDNAIVQRIMKSPKFAGRLEPEQIVGAVFKKGESSKLKRIKAVVTPGTWNKVRQVAMEDFLGKLVKRTDDPFEVLFQGKEFLTALDGYGKVTLNAMFGKGLTADLYRLGRVTQLVTVKQKFSGGLVAASIALHPLTNVGRLFRIFFMANWLNRPFAVKWLTEGLEAPNTRRGAAAITRLGVFIKALAEQHTDDPLPTQQGNAGRQPPGSVAADSQ